jgi:Lrp/AsnC family transcriptional regulator for asnA, asnC and gidA
MKKRTLDDFDSRLIGLLSEDGRMPVGDIASRLGVTAPTVRARIKSLEASGMLKVAGFINPFRHQEMTVALIGLNIIAYGKLEEVMRQLEKLEFVTWGAVVTGRYDVIAEVVFEGGMDELYRINSVEIPAIGNVVKSETFVILKSCNKWVAMPRSQTAQRKDSL